MTREMQQRKAPKPAGEALCTSEGNEKVAKKDEAAWRNERGQLRTLFLSAPT